MIYVTLGTMYKNFDRLVLAMDAYASASGERVVMQTGMSTLLPDYCEHFDFKSREDILAIQQDARVIVCHGGIGSVIEALRLEKPLIVVPRLKQFDEHNNDHQTELAQAVQRRGWATSVTDINDLPEACTNPPAPYTTYTPAKQTLIADIRARILGS
jgi:UDP-N-acetylglucosamine transferase subunit ALG13